MNQKQTRFNKSLFHFDGMYLVYGPGQYAKESRFIARFKYTKRDKSSFIKFLIANFTVEEYLSRMDAFQTPYSVLSAKGWVSPTQKKNRDLRDKDAVSQGILRVTAQ
jgi:2-phosphoglycerate kinase